MDKEPEVTLTSITQNVASHAPSVLTSMVLQNLRKHAVKSSAVRDIVTIIIPTHCHLLGDFNSFFAVWLTSPRKTSISSDAKSEFLEAFSRRMTYKMSHQKLHHTIKASLQ